MFGSCCEGYFPDKSKLFSNLRLSRQTMCRRIIGISNEIILKLRVRIRYFKYFSLAFDKCTDISDLARLVVFLSGVNQSSQVTEEMLNVINLKGTTIGEDIFHAFENCLYGNQLDLEILSGISTDGTPAMIETYFYKTAAEVLPNKGHAGVPPLALNLFPNCFQMTS
ncbi:general transcription factor II-I repeat domain-containing protein 2 [Caerostris extrusa]|uniref:General transcription factor II-I repeat domain-containing protein 2 n=1 Tax=Caerostris extrusa TaxID=172846 RepID=A0AAV4RUV7_CAEEX|nr:general transcription factor II-I repeat domain-containing protein 2 [Caerostris extrusa]